MTKIQNFENSRWRTDAILKMVLSLYILSRKASDFNEIWYADADCASKDGHMTKCHNFANSTWQTAAVMKIVFRLYVDGLLSDYREISCDGAELHSDTDYMTNIFRQSTFEPG